MSFKLDLATAMSVVALLGCGSTTSDGSPGDAGALPGDAALDAGSGPDVKSVQDAKTPPKDAVTADLCPTPKVPSANAWIESPKWKQSLTVSAFGEMGGECGAGLHILLAEDLEKMQTATIPGSPERHVIAIFAGDGFDLKPGGEGPITIINDLTGEQANGTMTINDLVLPDIPGAPTNAPRVSISFSVTQPGWSGGGSADAKHCDKADIFCP